MILQRHSDTDLLSLMSDISFLGVRVWSRLISKFKHIRQGRLDGISAID